LLVLVPIILISCSKVPLFSELHEEEANEIMAHLLEQKIECVKIAAKEGLWILQVPPDDFPLAMHTLQALGLPRQKLMKMGEVFQKSGLVSSPTEERIRFIDALSQELSDTLMKIDGVIAAKVHIALPNNDPLSDRSTPASASVFIKFRAGYDVESSTPDLKNLITKSIEGLTFENVELIMSQADAIPPPPKNDAHGDSGILAEWQAKLPPWGIPAISASGGFLIAAIFFAAMRSKKPA
jgi:type III secretion protein J